MASRPLTPGEIALAKTIFGEAIDYSAVRVKDGKYIFFQSKHSAMAPDGHLHMNKLYCEDYAKETENQGLFIHEMTHVWQFQNKVLKPLVTGAKLMLKHGFNYSSAYPYRLDAEKDLLDYNMEQQASIVQDYFLLKNRGWFHWKGRCQTDAAVGEKIALYEKVLEKFLQNPRYAERHRCKKQKKKKPGRN